METLDFITKKYNIDLNKESPFIVHIGENEDPPYPFGGRKELVKLFKELDFKVGVEVGVLEGGFSEILCQELPNTKIYSVDAWEYYPIANNFRKAHVYPPMYQRVKDRLAKYSNNVIIKKWSMDAVKDFEDESLDFVHIDSDHGFKFIVEDIYEWGKKIKMGGIISGHDFSEGASSKKYCHASHVVPAWTKAHYIHPWFVFKETAGSAWAWVKGCEFYKVK
jgi:predicted O-methyltransferase YrrM